MIFAKATTPTRGEIYLYDSIGEGFFGGITAAAFAQAMRDLAGVQSIDLYINSDGGSVFDGIAMYNMLQRFKGTKTAHIDGIAASIASVIPMACDDIRIAGNGMMMIHDPWGMSVGTAGDLRQYADSLDKVRETILNTYVARTGGTAAQIGAWMADETWMSADDAIARGFATVKTEAKTVNAKAGGGAMLAKFKHTPAHLLAPSKAANSLIARMNMRTQQQLNRGTAPVRA